MPIREDEVEGKKARLRLAVLWELYSSGALGGNKSNQNSFLILGLATSEFLWHCHRLRCALGLYHTYNHFHALFLSVLRPCL